MMKLTELLDIELAIVQAPMAGAQGSAMAIAVSNAGGLGSLPCAMLTADGMRTELESIKSQTNKPINVNFFCHAAPDADAERESAWRAALMPYYKQCGIDPAGIPTGPGRAPFSAEFADVLEEYQPAVVSFHFGLPPAHLLARVASWRSKICSSATTVEEARWLEAHGVDAVIAQGVEAGGHRGMFLNEDLASQVGTFALVPQVVDAVKVPVIAAGSVADGRGIAAAFALGAAAVQIGTAYLHCPESKITPMHRAALREARDDGTAMTNLHT